MAASPNRLLTALLVCATATACELAGGLWTRSLALTADGLHSLVHVGALLVALWGAGTAAERGGPRLAATVNALVIVALSILLAGESVLRLMSPTGVAYAPALAVTAFGLLANLLTIVALGGGSPEDINHRAALLHMLGDAMVAVLALLGLGAGWAFGWPWADAAAGLGGAVLLAGIGARLTHRAITDAKFKSVDPDSLFNVNRSGV